VIVKVRRIIQVGVVVAALTLFGWLQTDATSAASPGPMLYQPEPVAQPLDLEAPIATTDQVQGLASSLLTPERTGAALGLAVFDLVTGEAIYQVDANQGHIPASTMKILTATAALDTFGSQATLATEVLLSVVDQGQATVYLRAGGDVTLSPDQGQVGEIMGRAGLAELATEAAVNLRSRGAGEVAVILDDTIFTGPTTLPDWGWWPGAPWAGPITAMAINGGHDGAGFDDTSYSIDSALAAAQQFAALLGQAGQDDQLALPTFEVAGPVTRGQTSGGAQVIARVESAPIGQLVAYMLEHSDNVLAEALGRVTAVELGLPGSFEGAGQAIVQVVGELGLPTTALVVMDASGLSPGSRVPPATLAELLAAVAKPADLEGSAELIGVLRGLAVAGLEGTLAGRLTEAPGAGNVRAKTGTLTGVAALAGIVQTAQGRELAFVLMADQTSQVPYGLVRDSIDQFTSGLAALGG